MKFLKHGMIAASLLLGLSLTGHADGTLPFEDGTLPFGDGTLPFDMIGKAVELEDGVEINKDLLKIRFASPLGLNDASIDTSTFASSLSGLAVPEDASEAVACRSRMDFYEAFGLIETNNYGRFRIDGVCADQYVFGQRQIMATSSTGSLSLDGELSRAPDGSQVFSGTAIIRRGSQSRSFRFEVID